VSTGNGEIQKETTIGVTKTFSKEESWSVGASITVTATASAKFLGSGGEVSVAATISADYGQTFGSAVENSY